MMIRRETLDVVLDFEDDLDKSEHLKTKYKEQLTRWIGRPCHFRLLYKISRDGCSAQTFHQKCDGQGPTVTVLYNTNNTIYGGYLSQSWNSNGAYIYDDNAFLFRLKFNWSSDPQKFPVSKSTHAAYGHSSYGPMFGSGHDIYTFSGTINKSGNYFPLNGSVSNLGSSYNLNGQNSNSITNNNLQVADLEVYKVEVKTVDFELFKKPWRKFPGFKPEIMLTLKEEFNKYSPNSESGILSTNILLIGQIGAGKSSFFNSVNSIFCGKLTSKARSGSSEHSLTTLFRKYSIKDHNSGQTLKLRLCDTRGLEKSSTVDPQDIAQVLDGNISDRYQFNPTSPMTPDTLGFVRSPELGDMIHCVAFVVDGSAVDVMPESILKQFKVLQTRMNQKNIPQVVFLTKLDKVCPNVDEDVKHVFYSSAVRDAVDKIADAMGLPRSHVLPIKNYENETDLDPDMDILILKALKQAINFADDYIEEQMDKMKIGIVLMTKLDKICPNVNDDVTNTFTSSAICDAVDKVADIMGLPRAHVLPVKNYESEAKLKTGIDILVMEAIERCLDFADDFIHEQLDKIATENK